MKKRITLILLIIVNLFIWINSLMPGNVSSEQSNFIVNLIYPLFKNILTKNDLSFYIRKLAHLTEFLILGLLLSYYLTLKNVKYKYIITLIYGIIVAIIDETIQYFIPNRTCQITDVLIDSVGVIIGLLIYILYNKLRGGNIKDEKDKIN